MITPTDPFPYPQDPRSRLATPILPDGCYVYARDADGRVFVLPDGPHLHPKILGGGRQAMYAGDMTVRSGRILDLTNLSGTFPSADPDGLISTADELKRQGFTLEEKAVRFFPLDGSRPRVLR